MKLDDSDLVFVRYGGAGPWLEPLRRYRARDEVDRAWKIDGVIQDIEALHGAGRKLAGAEHGRGRQAMRSLLRTGSPMQPARSRRRPLLGFGFS